MSSNTKKILIIVSALLLCGILYFVAVTWLVPKPKEIDYTEFYQKYETLERSDKNKIVINGNAIATVVINDKAEYTCNLYLAHTEFMKQVTEDLAAGKTRVQVYLPDPGAGSWVNTAISIVGMILLVVVFIMILRQMSGGGSKAMNFGKVKTRVNDNVKVRFADVAGAEEEKEELKEIVEFLKAPKKFTELGARIPRGVLLVGPPGTGKTLFAKAVAGEAGVPFFSISGSDFVEMYVGVGASRVRDLFDIAKKNMPCIIFIDEIDAVGRQRGAGLGGGHDEREQTLNQLLVQMDGFETNDGIIVMAATNRADILDPALLRPGRFDRQIYVNAPDVRGREAIFKVHARNKPISPEINFKNLARMTAGFTGADIANLLNEAAILAARAGRKVIIMKDLYEGINKVLMGPQKKSRLVTESDKRITAYHEAGHAILAKLLPHCDPVQEVSIIPRGQAAGYTMTRPENDNSHESKNKWLDYITMALGGRVAEEIVIEDVCTGASGDIKQLTQIAKAMVTEWGMSDLGPIFYGSDHEVFVGRDFGSHSANSEEVQAKIDEQISKIVESCLERARNLLGQHKKVLDSMARVLIEKETIYADEVDMLMEGQSVADVLKKIEDRNEYERKGIPAPTDTPPAPPASPAPPAAPAPDADAKPNDEVSH